MLLCYQCRRLSTPQDQCEHCGADLPGRKVPPKIQVKTALLNRLSLEYRSGDIDRAAVESKLREQEDLVNRLLVESGDDMFSEEIVALMGEELRTGRRGLGAFKEALRIFRDWLDSMNPDELRRAVAMAAQADDYVHQAVEMNWSQYRTYLESMGEFLHQSGYQGPTS